MKESGSDVDKWLDAQPEDEREELRRVWEMSALARPPAPGESAQNDALARLNRALDVDTVDRAPDRLPRVARRPSPGWIGIGTAVAAGLLAFALVQVRVDLRSAPGEVTTIRLPDGSAVTLAANSALSYPRWLFHWRRGVALNGEAYFDVRAARRPFTISTANAEIRVVGTRFNVRVSGRGGLPQTFVVVETGAVRIANPLGQSPGVTVEAGYSSSIQGADGTPTSPRPVDLEVELAWRSGGLAFLEAPLQVILDELGRRFDVGIHLIDPASAPESLSLYLPRVLSVEDGLADICELARCKYRVVEAGYEVDTASSD